MSHHDEYRQWPFLSEEEFDLACAFFDRNYVGAKLGPTRKIFKLRLCRIATTGSSFIEILRLLQLPEDEDKLSAALAKLGSSSNDASEHLETGMEMVDEDEDKVSRIQAYVVLILF